MNLGNCISRSPVSSCSPSLWDNILLAVKFSHKKRINIDYWLGIEGIIRDEIQGTIISCLNHYELGQ